MTDFIAREALRRIQRLADAAAPAPDPKFTALARRASIARLLLRAAEMHPVDGAEAEYLRESSRRAERPYDEMKPLIGWDYFQAHRQTRADVVATGSLGGYLAETAVPAAADALRPVMACASLGATFIDARANISWPRQTAIATAQWLDGESTVATESQLTLSNLGLTPRTVAVYSEASRQLLLQADGADAVISRDLIRSIANAADLAAMFGTGASGQPTGLVNDANVLTFSGTSATIATFANAFVALGDGLDDDSGGCAANRSVAGLLRQRAETTGSSRTLWDGTLTNGTIINYPARSTTAMPSGSCIIGNWKFLIIATWGGGIELITSPYGDGVTGTTNFMKGIVGYRAMLTMDSGAIYPSAFSFASSVT
jgi:HK97 family phage major capsid protein